MSLVHFKSRGCLEHIHGALFVAAMIIDARATLRESVTVSHSLRQDVITMLFWEPYRTFTFDIIVRNSYG